MVLNPTKRDANGFFKIILLSSHLLISRHPVQTSKFGACPVTGYCSFNMEGLLRIGELEAREAAQKFCSRVLTDRDHDLTL